MLTTAALHVSTVIVELIHHFGWTRHPRAAADVEEHPDYASPLGASRPPHMFTVLARSRCMSCATPQALADRSIAAELRPRPRGWPKPPTVLIQSR
jgi:hypothetical protein